MGIVWISMPAHDQANRFNVVASLGTVGTVFRACCRPGDDNISFPI